MVYVSGIGIIPCFRNYFRKGRPVVDMVPVKGVVLFTDVCQDRFC